MSIMSTVRVEASASSSVANTFCVSTVIVTKGVPKGVPDIFGVECEWVHEGEL